MGWLLWALIAGLIFVIGLWLIIKSAVLSALSTHAEDERHRGAQLHDAIRRVREGQ